MTLVALIVALALGLWAAALVVAEQAPPAGQGGGDRSVGTAGGPWPVPELHGSRLALLLIAGVAGSSAVAWWTRPPVGALGTAALTVGLLYMVAEALPRGIAALSPRLAASLAPAVQASLALLRPIASMIAAAERGLGWLLPPGRPGGTEPGREERDMLAGVLSLRDRTVAEVMTPRLDIFALEAKAGWNEVVETVRRSEHARILVYNEDLDDIVGVLYAKDLTASIAGIEPPPEEWRELLRPAQFVPEWKSLAAQLRDFQRGPTHLAVVVDEFGGTSGLVTLEDVLEEVVGEIYGEYDVDEEPEVEREGEDRFWVAGNVPVDELSQLLGAPLERNDVSTVGGLIYSELGRVPQSGEEFRLGAFRVVVERVVRRRVQRVYFERVRDGSAVEAGAEGGP